MVQGNDNKDLTLEILNLLEERRGFEKEFKSIFNQLTIVEKMDVLNKLSISDLSPDIRETIEVFIEDIIKDLKSILNLEVRYKSRDFENSGFKRYLGDIIIQGFNTKLEILKISVGRGVYFYYNQHNLLKNFIEHLNILTKYIEELNRVRFEIIESSNSIFKNVNKMKEQYLNIFKKFVDAEYNYKRFLIETSNGLSQINDYFDKNIEVDMTIQGIIKQDSSGKFSDTVLDPSTDLPMEYNSVFLEKITERGYVKEITDMSYVFSINNSEGMLYKYFKLYKDSIHLLRADVELTTGLLLPRREFTDFDEELITIREHRFNTKSPIDIKFV